MKRFIALVIFAYVIQFGIVRVLFVLGLTSIARPLRSLTNPLTIPATWIVALWPSSFPFPFLAASILGPLVWAVVVEMLLRHFYDRRPDADVE